MTIYFAGTERDAVEGGITISTNSAYFNPLYSNLAVQVSNTVSCGYTLEQEIGVGGTISVGWTLYSVYSNSPPNNMIFLYDSNLQLAAKIDSRALNVLNITVYNTSGTSAFMDIPWIYNTLHRMDLEITNIGGRVYAKAYRNNLQIGEASVAGTGRGVKVINILSGITNFGYVSEVIIADEPTLGMRVKTYRPTADGTHTTWDGNFENVNNNDVGIDAISTQLPNAAETFLHGATLNEGTAIRALCVGAAAASEDPAGCHGVIYSGGTLHPQAFVKPLALGTPPNVAIFETNPATGLSWTPTEFNALEFGVQHADY